MNGYCEAITWRGSRCSRKARTRGLCRRHKAIQESGRDVYTADDVRAEPYLTGYWHRYRDAHGFVHGDPIPIPAWTERDAEAWSAYHQRKRAAYLKRIQKDSPVVVEVVPPTHVIIECAA